MDRFEACVYSSPVIAQRKDQPSDDWVAITRNRPEALLFSLSTGASGLRLPTDTSLRASTS